MSSSSSLWRRLQKFTQQTFSSSAILLQPQSPSCAVCGSRDGKTPRHDRFPQLCGRCYGKIPWITQMFCPVCGRPEWCPDCIRRTGTAFVCNRSAVRYDPVIRQWLALYKYRGNEGLLPLLGEMMAMAYRGMIAELSLTSQEQVQIHGLIPVPVSEERLLERGFNQAEQLGSYLAGSERLALYDILHRTRHSDKQSFKTRGARLRDTEQLFAADLHAAAAMLDSFNSSGLKTLRLLIIDDIYTTGSTANSCAQALAEALKSLAPALPVRIYILTLARS
ncbi:ComF family protein [Paenibacillus montanisoli]|uniref:ComF family protein n=1 Tax=Paenibacillus montanisoli TaxID=2081970 RepID=A0A328TXU6_9BACL|nr:ComF family protein [Paenibacillus montanisoli]RAP73941.1 ComF family protein [Paenibacillus montanisoli]